MFHAPLIRELGFFRAKICAYCLYNQKVEKNDNNCMLHMRVHARTCAMSINAEIKKFVKQLRKTNAQHKT